MREGGFLKIFNKSDFDRTNVRIGKWRIIAVLIFGFSYTLFYSRSPEWIFYWLAWCVYAAIWIPFQGRHTGENPGIGTYLFMVGDVLFFLIAANIAKDILYNFSAILILPMFQYLLRYGRRVALHYTWISVAAIVYICLFQYPVHPEKHFVVSAVMFLISFNEGRLVQENRELRRQLFNLAIYDELTGLHNYRFFTQALERELNRSKRYGYQLTLLLIDIDSFKKINDDYGHIKGNVVLKELSGVIADSVRDTDYAARYGGEEFVVVLPQTSLEDGYQTAERLRQKISECQFDFGSVTVSIGVSTYPVTSTNKDLVIKHADLAMYAAKKKGKNRVECYRLEI